jgi:hypothetical protein
MAFKIYKNFHKPNRDSLHTSLYNIAAVAGISSALFQRTVIIVSATVVCFVYHVIVLVYDDDYL